MEIAESAIYENDKFLKKDLIWTVFWPFLHEVADSYFSDYSSFITGPILVKFVSLERAESAIYENGMTFKIKPIFWPFCDPF